MAGFFSSEYAPRDAALRCLNWIFSARRRTKIPPLHAGAGSVSYNVAAHGAGVMVLVLKNEITDLNEIPQIVLACYVARLYATGMDMSEAGRQLYLRWRVPCLSLSVVGESDISAFHAYMTLSYP